MQERRARQGSACTLSGAIPGSGPLEASILVGFDSLHKNVHFMAMTSDEEVHDHVCNWRSATDLVCDPLRGGLMGDESPKTSRSRSPATAARSAA